MNKYLLLRNNKQSGPFTVDELTSMGIKPYDLVWLEGKSAAWRYPSEMDDLKAFAPAVEEQPYDRFYKKPAQQNNSTEQLTKEEKEISIPDRKKPDQKLQTGVEKSKSVYVTLPATQQIKSSGNTATEKVKPIHVIETNNKNAVSKPTPIINDKEPNGAEINKDQPVQEVKPVESFSRLIEDSQKKYQAKSLPGNNHSESGTGKKSVKILSAICALLCIAVILQAILYSKNMSATRELDVLVKQIQASENKKNNPTIPDEHKSNAANNATTENSTSTADLPLQPPVTILNKEGKKQLVTKQNSKGPSAKNEIGNAVTSNEIEKEILAEQSSTINQEEALRKNEASIELARKNLSQLVSIEKNKYKTGVLGGISNLQLTLSNKSLYYIDRIEVEINFLNADKKIVKTQTVYFDKIAPGEQLKLDVPKSKRGVFVDYSIKKINSKEVDLAGR